MPRPRTPTELLDLKGAFRKDPQRRRPVGPKATAGIGEPPEHLRRDEAQVWRELVGNAPANVLTSADRAVLEIAARLLAKFRADWLTGAELGILRGCLGELGWTPASRSRVIVPEEPPSPSPWDELMPRPQ